MNGWFQKYAENVASAYGLRFVQMALSVAAIPLLITSIGAEGFGVVIFLSSIIGYLGLFDLALATRWPRRLAKPMRPKTLWF